jgi:hypothetical protein
MIPFCMLTGVQAAENQPPAGQMCAEGSYVVGFDSDSNIICSAMPSTAVKPAVEAAAPAESLAGEGCPPNCPAAASVRGSEKVPDTPVNQQGASAGVAVPVISKLKPWSVVFGARETSITITGSGFNADTVVKFQGTSYTPSVNPAGTELVVTIATRDLTMGFYAISVSNGPDLETTRSRALEVY